MNPFVELPTAFVPNKALIFWRCRWFMRSGADASPAFVTFPKQPGDCKRINLIDETERFGVVSVVFSKQLPVVRKFYLLKELV